MEGEQFLISKFREYYLKEGVKLPPRFTRREYGFLFFQKNYMRRHIGFSSASDIRKFLVDNVPKHAYYSTAYYKNPGAPTMEEKGWLGADLVFDLDADHIPETEGKSYREMLEIVKVEAERLLREFLMDDLGFDEDSISISFSGGRGYHIHVRREDVFNLGSDERREIVNYITGEGVQISKFIGSRVVETREKGRGRGKRFQKILLLYPEDYGGWYSRVRRGIDEELNRLHSIFQDGGRDALYEEIARYLKDKKSVKKVVDDLLSESQYSTRKIEHLASSQQSEKLGILKESSLKELLNYFEKALNLKGETDEPVTTDIHRLIRLIGSLHGKTGLAVMDLSFEEFKTFEPLRDAIPKVFREGSSLIFSENPVEIEMNSKKFRIDGEVCVPDFVAIFAVARGLASYAGKCRA